jgi:hypothetical protein
MTGRKFKKRVHKWVKWLFPPIVALLVYALGVASIFALFGPNFDALSNDRLTEDFLYWFLFALISGTISLIITIIWNGHDWIDPSKMPK